jgi:hypothetical protein
MWWLFADELGGIHPEGLSELADRAPLGFRHVAEEGESYMGLFPRTRTDASRGALRVFVCLGERMGRREMPEQDHAEPRIFIRHHKM